MSEIFTIKQVSERTGLTASTLRYYDKEGLIPNLSRSRSGIRQYSDQDIAWIELICCLKNSGMALEKIKEFMNLCLAGESACEAKRELLEEHKALILKQMKTLHTSLDIINYKLEHYKEIGIFHIDG